MRAATHLAFAGLVGVVASGFGSEPGVAGGAALAAGALLPDLDTTTSGLGRFCKPASSVLERKLGHRTLTHSLLGLAVIGVAAGPLMLVSFAAWAWLLAGALTHILLDTANITGVPLFWPARLEVVLVRDRSMRVPYGSPKEFTWLGCFAIAALALMPLSTDGFSPWFHRMLGTPYGAVEDYLGWREGHEVWARVRGHNLVTGEAIDRRYRVIDALNTEELVVEDEAGRAYRVGLGRDSDIVSTRVTAWRGRPVLVRSDHLEVGGRTVAEVVAALPRRALRVYVTGVLKLHDSPTLPATSGRMARVTASGGVTQLRVATPTELAGLSEMVVEDGSLVVRAEYAAGSEVPAVPVALPAKPGRIFTIRLPGLPSLAGIVVKEGDHVDVGQPMARYIDDAALEEAEAAVKAAQRALEEARQALAEARSRAELERARLEEAVVRAKAELARTERLVDGGAEPERARAEAVVKVREAERAQVEGLTRRTSEVRRLEGAVVSAREAARRATQANKLQTEGQWVRSPVEGEVVSVRIDNSSKRSLDARIAMLRAPHSEVAPNRAATTPTQELVQDASTLP